VTDKPPRALQARVDDELADDIAVLAKAGLSGSDMVKHGVRMLRNLCEQSWLAGAVPEGQMPVLREFVIAPPE
jgi:hypothetical protein